MGVCFVFVFFGVFFWFFWGFAPVVGGVLGWGVVYGFCVYHTFSTVEFLFFRRCSRVVVYNNI